MSRLKHSNKDYTEADLPTNRREVFRDCYREQFPVIFRAGLAAAGAFLPYVVVLLMRDGYLSAQVAEGVAYADAYRTANTKYGVLFALAIGLFFLFYAGVIRVLRQLTWREPIFFGEDYRNGFKFDAFRFALVGVFVGIVHTLVKSLSDSVVTYLLQGVYLTIVLPSFAWFILQNVYYKVDFLGGLRNGILHYLRSLPVTLLLLFLTFLPFISVTVFAPTLVRYVGLILLAVFWTVPVTMVWLLYASHLFDITTNRENYPQIYRRGMTDDLQSKK